MSKATVSDVIQVLRDIQLLPPDQLEQVHQEVSLSADPGTLVEKLVRPDRLTTYQAEQLVEAKGQDLCLGPYRLLEPLGEGGMGRVFKAIHSGLGRVVALKVIRQDQKAQDPEMIRRFQREARAAAQMSHPNVMMVYDAGHEGDRYFIAMEFVKGMDLARLVRDEGPLPITLACEYVRQVALGLQHAYERGLVHRDIKPANLLVTLAGSGDEGSKAPSATFRRTSYTVKILDMGLARLTVTEGSTAHGSLTCEGSVMGTPDYIAPEQARNAHRVDIRADLYSLGCTLYFLLTGRPPFPQGTMLEKLLMHQLDQPTPLEELRRDVTLEVVAIVRKLMAKRPEERYATPMELVRELDKVSSGSSVRTVPQMSPLPVELSPSLSIAALAAPSTAVVAASPTPVPAPSDRSAPLSGEVPTKIAVLKGHRGMVMALAFSPNRDRLATAGIDGTVRIWDFSGRKPTQQAVLQANSGAVQSLMFAPNNQELATGSGTLDGRVRLWTLSESSALPRTILQKHRAPVDALAYSPDGTRLATGGTDKSIQLWDLTTPEPKERAVLRGHTNIVKTLAFSPDARMLASGSHDNTVRLWNIGRIWSRERAALQGHTGHVLSVAFSANAHFLASSSTDQSIRVWDLSGVEPAEYAILEEHHGAVRALVFPPGGRTLVSISDPGHLILWDLATGEMRREWALPPTMFSSVAFTHDGKYLATGNSDGTVFVFRLARQLDG